MRCVSSLSQASNIWTEIQVYLPSWNKTEVWNIKEGDSTVCPGPASPHPHSKIGKQSFLPFQRKTRCVVRLSFPVLCGSLYSLQVKYLQSNSSVCRGRSCHWCPLNTSAPPRPAPPESARLLSLFLSRYDPGHCWPFYSVIVSRGCKPIIATSHTNKHRPGHSVKLSSQPPKGK